MAEGRKHYYAFLERTLTDRVQVKFLTHPDEDFVRHRAEIGLADAKEIFRKPNNNWREDKGLMNLPYFGDILRTPERLLVYDVGEYNLLRARLKLPVIGGDYDERVEESREAREELKEALKELKEENDSSDSGEIDLAQ